MRSDRVSSISYSDSEAARQRNSGPVCGVGGLPVVFWGVQTSLVSQSPILSTVIFSLFLGVGLAAYFAYRSRARHEALADGLRQVVSRRQPARLSPITRELALRAC